MNALDWAVVIVAILGIAVYGIVRTRGQKDLKSYLQGRSNTSWFVIGLSVMATQASAVTFLSTPGQGYESGLGFVQNYFGAPFALILIAIVFLPIYRKLKVYTAYEYLGQRFDSKTRLLGAFLFLLQRGIGAGITIYAPAIVLSSVMHWRLDLTIIGSGLVVIAYTAMGGSEAVTLTQKYQLGIIFVGMIAAFCIIIVQLMQDLSMSEVMTVAGGFKKLQGVNYSIDVKERYTFWSGLLGGFFLALSYFGTDQSQVQRYLSGTGVRESRLGLMFNAVCKIPMQFFILLLGTLLFVFYQFHPSPIYFNEAEWQTAKETEAATFQSLEDQYAQAQSLKREHVLGWIQNERIENHQEAESHRSDALTAHDQAQTIRQRAKDLLKEKNKSTGNDIDYIFIHFIVDRLPHGLIGLLITVFFAATLSSKAGELNALGSTTTIDIYRHIVKNDQDDKHYVIASKWITVAWGIVALLFALFANMSENLIQATNIIASIFYGVMLGMFVVAFFMRWIQGTAVFIAAILSQITVFILFFSIDISYLWYNIIGCLLCMSYSSLVQLLIDVNAPAEASSA